MTFYTLFRSKTELNELGEVFHEFVNKEKAHDDRGKTSEIMCFYLSRLFYNFI